MSKYTELAKKANQVEDIEVKIANAEPVLKAEVEAIVSQQKAVVIRAKSALEVAEKAVDVARGKVTDNGRTWLENLNSKKTQRDQAAEEFNLATELLEDYEAELKLFS
jgi:hypothetical protein